MTIPLIAPVITVVVVLNTINGIKAFDQIWVMTSGGPTHASDTLGTYLYYTTTRPLVPTGVRTQS